MKKQPIVAILEREDMNLGSRTKLDINDINHADFNDKEPILKSDMVIFIDTNGETRILKNRWGDKEEKRISRLFDKFMDSLLSIGNVNKIKEQFKATL